MTTQKRLTFIAVLITALAIAFLSWPSVRPNPDTLPGMLERHAFERMTPAQHLEAARREALTEQSDIQRVKDHLAALPSGSPESAAAAELRKQVAEREDDLRLLEASEAEARVRENAPSVAVGQLQRDLSNLGYDLTVRQSSFPNEIEIISSDFGDTDPRVHFLSLLRRSPAAESACLAGFDRLRLSSSRFRASWLPFGFSESYSLDCVK
jgi:hypothetical protein